MGTTAKCPLGRRHCSNGYTRDVVLHCSRATAFSMALKPINNGYVACCYIGRTAKSIKNNSDVMNPCDIGRPIKVDKFVEKNYFGQTNC